MKQVKILSMERATHDVVHIKTEKPEGISFYPGQAVDVSLNKPSWKKELRPFTFTSLPADEYLEFFIKVYPDHKGVTEQIGKLSAGDMLFVGDVFGDIQYKGTGVFIAGGAGITPFIAILKDLEKNLILGSNQLIFANRTSDDVIEPVFFDRILGKKFINVFSQEEKMGSEHGYVTKELIESRMENRNCYFYLCGPPPMMDAVLKLLKELGIASNKIVLEAF